jgi:EmrB/QacA subfamily drug resistance transporter
MILPRVPVVGRQIRNYKANYRWWAFLAISVGAFTSAAGELSIIVALPTIAAHFQTDLPTVQWAIAGFALTISALLLPMGRLADIVGLKPVYLVGFLIFVLGAGLAGFSTNMMTLILAMVIHGCGAAMIQGTGRAMTISIFPSSERGKVLGAQMSVMGAGAIAGPALGGLAVSLLDWRWVFFITASEGLLALAAVLFIVDRHRLFQDNQRPKFDWLGAVLSAGVLVIFLVAIGNGQQAGWTSPPIVAAMLASIALLGSFIWWELRTPAPILDLRLFKNRVFALGVSTGFILFVATYSVFFLMPFYLQRVLGYSPGQIGLIFVPMSLAMIVVGPVSGRLSDRYGWWKFKAAGMALTTAGMFLLSRVTETSSLGLLMPGMILLGLGMGMFGSPNNSSILSTVEPARYGVISGLLALLRNSASVASIALGTTIVTVTMASMGFSPSLEAVTDAGDGGVLKAFTSGLRLTFLVMGSLVLVGLVLSMLKSNQREETPA